MSAITVIAQATVKPGCELKFEEAFKKMVPFTHAEAGCQLYVLHKSIENPTLYVVIERWAGKKDLDDHLATPHVQQLFSIISELLSHPAQISTFIELPMGSSSKGKMPQ